MITINCSHSVPFLSASQFDKNRVGKLVKAANCGDEDKVLTLLNSGTPIDGLHMDCTALGQASRKGEIGVVRLLLSRGADVNLVLDWGRTALHVATARGEFEIVELLLQSGADHSLQETRFGNTALHDACSSFDGLDTAKVLLRYGADPLINNKRHMTAFECCKSFKLRTQLEAFYEELSCVMLK